MISGTPFAAAVSPSSQVSTSAGILSMNVISGTDMLACASQRLIRWLPQLLLRVSAPVSISVAVSPTIIMLTQLNMCMCNAMCSRV